jgi:hypothetical protein
MALRQPEMERELRRLGEGAGQHQREDQGIERRGLDHLAFRQQHAELVGAADVAEHQHARGEEKPAAAGHHQRHAGALPARRRVAPEADQEEGRQARQLPEDQHEQDVVGEDDADHRALEEQQVGVEAADGVLPAEIVARIDDDQRADGEDHRGEEQAEPIGEEAEGEADLGHPGGAGEHRLAAIDRRCIHQQQSEARERDGEGHGHRRVTPRAGDERRQQRPEKGDERHENEVHRACPAGARAPISVVSAPIRPAAPSLSRSAASPETIGDADVRAPAPAAHEAL